MGDDLRVAVLGYGLAGRHIHAPLIEATPGLRVTAIVTADAGRAAAAAAERPAARVLPEAADVWASASSYDLVVVATANVAHVPQAVAALDAGLPVVVDKPLCADADTARRLADHARERGLPLGVFQNRRWDGDFLTLLDLLAEGRLGTVHRFESRFERWRPRAAGGWREKGPAEEMGGVLYDLGAHLVDQALVAFGPVVRVHGERRTTRAGTGADDDAFVALEHRNGVRSHLWMSLVAADIGPRLRVLGSAGAYVKHGLDPQEQPLRAGAAPGGPGWGLEPPECWGTLQAGDDESHPVVTRVPTRAGAWQAYYAGVAAQLRDGAPPPVDVEDVVTALRVLDAARRSAASGKDVLLDN